MQTSDHSQIIQYVGLTIKVRVSTVLSMDHSIAYLSPKQRSLVLTFGLKEFPGRSGRDMMSIQREILRGLHFSPFAVQSFGCYTISMATADKMI